MPVYLTNVYIKIPLNVMSCEEVIENTRTSIKYELPDNKYAELRRYSLDAAKFCHEQLYAKAPQSKAFTDTRMTEPPPEDLRQS